MRARNLYFSTLQLLLLLLHMFTCRIILSPFQVIHGDGKSNERICRETIAAHSKAEVLCFHLQKQLVKFFECLQQQPTILFYSTLEAMNTSSSVTLPSIRPFNHTFHIIHTTLHFDVNFYCFLNVTLVFVGILILPTDIFPFL